NAAETVAKAAQNAAVRNLAGMLFLSRPKIPARGKLRVTSAAYARRSQGDGNEQEAWSSRDSRAGMRIRSGCCGRADHPQSRRDRRTALPIPGQRAARALCDAREC